MELDVNFLMTLHTELTGVLSEQLRLRGHQNPGLLHIHLGRKQNLEARSLVDCGQEEAVLTVQIAVLHTMIN